MPKPKFPNLVNTILWSAWNARIAGDMIRYKMRMNLLVELKRLDIK